MQNTGADMRILVVRNDKIGDFMLAWPSFAMLKQSCDCHLSVLVASYTAPLAHLCPWIDSVIIDSGSRGSKDQQKALQEQLKDQFDIAITLFSTGRIGWLLWRVNIPYRLAPATKLAQIFYNHRLPQRRSRSEKPEYEYNLDLIRYFLADQRLNIVEPESPYLVFPDEILSQVRAEIAQSLAILSSASWVMVHCGSGGSANNLSIEQYAELIACLYRHHPERSFLLTAGPGEEIKTRELADQLNEMQVPNVVYVSTDGLERFAQVLANAELFIAGSTGPLHMASALDVPTVGFFPQRRSATPLRWRPLNSEGRHLAFSPPKGKDSEQNMALLNISECADTIRLWWCSWMS
jgi:ADP-heptose:LPS heptosyltransferase